MKERTILVVIAALLGVVVGLQIALLLGRSPVALGQAALSSGDWIAVATPLKGANASCLWLFDCKNRHLAVYELQSRVLNLVAVRPCEELSSPRYMFGRMRPTPQEVRRKIGATTK